MSDIQTLMRNANPVPDPASEFGNDDLDALLLLTHRRSTEMDAKELTRAVERDPRNRRSGWYVAAAAFGVVVLLIGSVVLLNRSTEPEIPTDTTPASTTTVAPTTTTESPGDALPAPSAETLEFVDGLVADINAGDAAAAADRLRTAVKFVGENGEEFDERNTWIAGIGLWAALDSTVTVDSCRLLTGGLTRCDLIRVSEHEAFHPNVEKIQLSLRLEGESVAYLAFAIDRSGPFWAVQEDYEAWLEAKDPDAYRQIIWWTYSDASEAADLQRQLVTEYRDEAGLSAAGNVLTDEFAAIPEGEWRVDSLGTPMDVEIAGDWWIQPNSGGWAVFTHPLSTRPGDRDIVFVRPTVLKDPTELTVFSEANWPLDDIEGWIDALVDGVVATPPTETTVGGVDGIVFEISIETGSCSSGQIGQEACLGFVEGAPVIGTRDGRKMLTEGFRYVVYWLDQGEYAPIVIVVGALDVQADEWLPVAEAFLERVTFGDAAPIPES